MSWYGLLCVLVNKTLCDPPELKHRPDPTRMLPCGASSETLHVNNHFRRSGREPRRLGGTRRRLLHAMGQTWAPERHWVVLQVWDRPGSLICRSVCRRAHSQTLRLDLLLHMWLCSNPSTEDQSKGCFPVLWPRGFLFAYSDEASLCDDSKEQRTTLGRFRGLVVKEHRRRHLVLVCTLHKPRSAQGTVSGECVSCNCTSSVVIWTEFVCYRAFFFFFF